MFWLTKPLSNLYKQTNSLIKVQSAEMRKRIFSNKKYLNVPSGYNFNIRVKYVLFATVTKIVNVQLIKC